MNILPAMEVEFYPNTGMEVGWAIALDRALQREGWSVWPEVQTSPGKFVDLMARLGPVLLVIEVKGKAAGPDAVTQLARYLSDIKLSNPRALGVLAAPRLTHTVRWMPDDAYFLPLVRVSER